MAVVASWRCFLCNQVTRIEGKQEHRAGDYGFEVVKERGFNKYVPVHFKNDPECPARRKPGLRVGKKKAKKLSISRARSDKINGRIQIRRTK